MKDKNEEEKTYDDNLSNNFLINEPLIKLTTNSTYHLYTLSQNFVIPDLLYTPFITLRKNKIQYLLLENYIIMIVYLLFISLSN